MLPPYFRTEGIDRDRLRGLMWSPLTCRMYQTFWLALTLTVCHHRLSLSPLHMVPLASAVISICNGTLLNVYSLELVSFCFN